MVLKLVLRTSFNPELIHGGNFIVPMDSISSPYFVLTPVSFFDLTFHFLINSYLSYLLLKAFFFLHFKKIFYLFIYLFIYGCVGSSFLCEGFL